MAVDQVIYAFKGNSPKSETDFPDIDGAERIFHCGRYEELQMWMTRLYCQKGGQRIFDGDPVILTREDILNLKASQLPNSTPYDDFLDERLIDVALEKLQQGYQLYYYVTW